MKQETSNQDTSQAISRCPSTSLRPPAQATELIIFGSQILGSDSLLSQGFDWLVAPFSLSDLTQLLTKIKIREDQWSRRIRLWQQEGAMDTCLRITPGVICWKVRVKTVEERIVTLDVLCCIASQLVGQPAAVSLAFPEEGFDAETIASKISDGIFEAQPFWYSTS